MAVANKWLVREYHRITKSLEEIATNNSGSPEECAIMRNMLRAQWSIRAELDRRGVKMINFPGETEPATA